MNYLLRRENGHSLSIGDLTVVFWAEADITEQCQVMETFFESVLGSPPISYRDDGETSKISSVLAQIAIGIALPTINPNLLPSTKFYILGLTPNSSRLSIRFWLNTEFGFLMSRISEHYQDII